MDLSSLKVKSDYEFKLDNFEGPLDLLLHLIKEAKIDIREIFVSKITEQYLKYMEQLEDIDVEKATDFLDMAATLVEIKSDSLLPKIEEVLPEDEDPKEKFFRMVEEYKMLREASEELKVIENVDRFYKEPDRSVGDVRVVFKDFTLDGLLDAFSKMLLRLNEKKRVVEPKEIKKDPFTVAQKYAYIKESLFARKQISFFDLFAEDYEKSEVITTFQALLEILKSQIATCTQYGVFEDITIMLREDAKTAAEEPQLFEENQGKGDGE